MRNIVIPTDFSSSLNSTLLYGLKLMKGQECNFFILNLPQDYFTLQKKENLECHHFAAFQRLQKLRQKVIKFFPTEKFQLELISPLEFGKLKKDFSLILAGMGESFSKNSFLDLLKKPKSAMLFVPGTQDFERPRNLMISLRPGVGIREFDWSHLTKVFGNHSFSLEIQNMYSGPVDPALEAKEEFELNQFLEFYRPKIFKIHTRKVAEILKKNNINDDLDLHVIPVTDNEDFYRILSLPQEMSISESTTPVILLPPKRKTQPVGTRRGRRKSTQRTLEQ